MTKQTTIDDIEQKDHQNVTVNNQDAESVASVLKKSNLFFFLLFLLVASPSIYFIYQHNKPAELSDIKELVQKAKVTGNKKLMASLAKKLEKNPNPLRYELETMDRDLDWNGYWDKKERERVMGLEKLQSEIQSLRQ